MRRYIQQVLQYVNEIAAVSLQGMKGAAGIRYGAHPDGRVAFPRCEPSLRASDADFPTQRTKA